MTNEGTDTMETICDRCGLIIPTDEANDVEAGDWEGATLCNDCYAEVVDDQDGQQ